MKESVKFMVTSICLVLTSGWTVMLFIKMWKIRLGEEVGEGFCETSQGRYLVVK